VSDRQDARVTEPAVEFASWQIRAVHAGYGGVLMVIGLAQFTRPWSSGFAEVTSTLAVLAGLIYLVRALRLTLILRADEVVVRNLLRTYRVPRPQIIGASSDGSATVLFSRVYYPQFDARCLSIRIDTRLMPIDVTATALLPVRERERALARLRGCAR
jgi:hypothetical protein